MKKITKKLIIINCVILLLFSVLITHATDSTTTDFTIDIKNKDITLKLSESIIIAVNINSTSNLNENITIQGKWIGEKPNNITVNLSKQYGIFPFTFNTTFTSNGSKTGNYEYEITAIGTNYTNSETIEIELIPNNIITIQTNKTNYYKGEKIKIYGNLTNLPKNNKIYSDNVYLTIKHNNWVRTFITSLINNSYETYYNISYGDPKGLWTITSKILDENEDNITNYKKINISLPPDIVRYNVIWHSPSETAIYQRGSTFNVSVFVTENDIGVKNLTTNCILPNFVKINLSEIKKGYYKGAYKIPWNSDIGILVLTFEGIKNGDKSLGVGGGNTSIEIQTAPIKIELIEPCLDQYNYGDKIEIKTRLKYLDNTTIKNADVKAKILDETFTLFEKNNGIYSTNYTIKDKNTGSLLIEISAEDPFGNSGSSSKIVNIIINEESEVPIFTILIITAFIILIILVFHIFKKRLHMSHMQDVNWEIKELKRQQDEAAEKYYKKGSISRQAYDLLRKEHSERLAELESRGGNRHKKNIFHNIRRKKR